MSEILVGLISGFIFGLGLCLSGLADPSVVQGFLDVAGAWNPALLFVMGAGLTVTLIGYRLVFGRGRPLWSPRFNVPTSMAIDTPLISGSVIFGIGTSRVLPWPRPRIARQRTNRSVRLHYRDGYGHDRGAMDAGESGGSTNGIRAELNVVKR